MLESAKNLDLSGIDQQMIKGWVKGLRSGSYQPCFGKLTHKGGYCVLGVLADTIGLPLETHEHYDNNGDFVDTISWFVDPQDNLPLASCLPSRILPDMIQSELIRLNDLAETRQEIFERLAAVIEVSLLAPELRD